MAVTRSRERRYASAEASGHGHPGRVARGSDEGYRGRATRRAVASGAGGSSPPGARPQVRGGIELVHGLLLAVELARAGERDTCRSSEPRVLASASAGRPLGAAGGVDVSERSPPPARRRAISCWRLETAEEAAPSPCPSGRDDDSLAEGNSAEASPLCRGFVCAIMTCVPAPPVALLVTRPRLRSS